MHKYKQTALHESRSSRMERLQGERFGRGGAAEPAHQGGHSALEDMKCKGHSKRLQVP